MSKNKIPFISFLILVLLKPVIARCDTVASDDGIRPALHMDCSGMFGGKLNGSSFGSGEAYLRNHGYVYLCPDFRYSLLDRAVIKTRVRILNEELSCFEKFRTDVEPEIELRQKSKSCTVALRCGYIDRFTLGQGLTVKEFSQPGAIGTISYGNYRVSGGIFALGYGFDEDLGVLTAGHESFPIKLSVLAINKAGLNPDLPLRGNQYYLTGYLLPWFEYSFYKFTLYAEYGYKLRMSGNVDTLFESSPKSALAGLVGVRTGFKNNRMTFSGNAELRASQKGFIPVTGVKMERFTRFWNEGDSRANWVDFFDSRKDFLWAYANFDLSYSLSDHWRIFLRDELLYFKSKQKEVTVFPIYVGKDSIIDGGIVRYEPSTNYYNIGICFVPMKYVFVEAAVKNKLISWEGLNAALHGQRGQRFFPMSRPFFEIRVMWDSKAER